jgi:DNA polymerase III epsilon subunit-like protein
VLPDEHPLYGAPGLAVDFETTWTDGGDADAAEQHPVSVSAAAFSVGVVGSERTVLSSRVRPAVPVRPEASAVHGLTDADLRDAPPEAEVLPALLRLLEGRVLVAYNLPFDHGVLEQSCRRSGLPAPPFRGLCPLVLARTVHHRERFRDLPETCRRLGLPPPRARGAAHAADADALSAAAALSALLRTVNAGCRGLEPAGIRTEGDAWRWTVREALAWEERFEGRSRDLPWTSRLRGRT